MEQPQRSSLNDNDIYLCFDSINVYLFVGRNCDPLFLMEMFEVEDIR